MVENKIDQFSDYNQQEVNEDLELSALKATLTEELEQLKKPQQKELAELNKEILRDIDGHKLQKMITSSLTSPDGEWLSYTQMLHQPTHDFLTQITLDYLGYHHSQIDSAFGSQTAAAVGELQQNRNQTHPNQPIAHDDKPGPEFFQAAIQLIDNYTDGSTSHQYTTYEQSTEPLQIDYVARDAIPQPDTLPRLTTRQIDQIQIEAGQRQLEQQEMVTPWEFEKDKHITNAPRLKNFDTLLSTAKGKPFEYIERDIVLIAEQFNVPSNVFLQLLIKEGTGEYLDFTREQELPYELALYASGSRFKISSRNNKRTSVGISTLRKRAALPPEKKEQKLNRYTTRIRQLADDKSANLSLGLGQITTQTRNGLTAQIAADPDYQDQFGDIKRDRLDMTHQLQLAAYNIKTKYDRYGDRATALAYYHIGYSIPKDRATLTKRATRNPVIVDTYNSRAKVSPEVTANTITREQYEQGAIRYYAYT